MLTYMTYQWMRSLIQRFTNPSSLSCLSLTYFLVLLLSLALEFLIERLSVPRVVILCRWCVTWLRLCNLHIICARLPAGVHHHKRMETGHCLHSSLCGCNLCTAGSLLNPVAWSSTIGTSRVGHFCCGNDPQYSCCK